MHCCALHAFNTAQRSILYESAVCRTPCNVLYSEYRTFHQTNTYEPQFAEDDTGAEVAVGQTRVATVITAELVAPFGDRGNEGRVNYNVQLSPLAFPDPTQSGMRSRIYVSWIRPFDA
jgi:hypothetical protein